MVMESPSTGQSGEKHNGGDGASLRTGSTQSGSDDPLTANETDKFL